MAPHKMNSFKTKKQALVLDLEEVRNVDVALVGGKNASLGEMIHCLKERDIKVPGGFAITSKAYWKLVEYNSIYEPLVSKLKELKENKVSLSEAGNHIRQLFLNADFPPTLKKEILQSYKKLCEAYNDNDVDMAIRSSATAEDLPEASFAGQQETYLNVRGEGQLLEACLKCFASLFTNRAIIYREQREIDHMAVALSIGAQKMVRSDLAGAGVAFTLDTESGFPDVVLINAAWGLGEAVVKGEVNPDQYTTFKPFLKSSYRPLIGKELGSKRHKIVYGDQGATKTLATSKSERASFVLDEEDIFKLSRWACVIEEHYGRAMDIEWAKDGESGELYIVQARPETAHSQKKSSLFKRYRLKEKKAPLLEGLSIGSSIATGEVSMVEKAKDIDSFKEGSVLVAIMTDPDWGPIMKKAKAIITDEGGRACHAAIVGRELGIPVVVGTGSGTKQLKDGQKVTVSCGEGETGKIYDGELEIETQEVDLKSLPKVKTRIMINAADPSSVFNWWRLPVKGIGLARMEFIINNLIKAHPMALVRFPNLSDKRAIEEIEKLTQGRKDKKEFFVDKLSLALGKMAASQWPEPVVVRFSDFKTNEYAQLIGGKEFEGVESNPMLGFRGASRYYSDRYREGFALECWAMKKAREKMGFTNIVAMIPFCRTLQEADKALGAMEEFGLKRGEYDLRVYVMAEIPSNVILAEKFAKKFDGFSIGSNDLTQLTLGIDRDSRELAPIFDERDEAVKRMISMLLKSAHSSKTPVGICGEAPSNYPDFAEFLVKSGIDSISLNPDSVVKTLGTVAKAESDSARANRSGRQPG